MGPSTDVLITLMKHVLTHNCPTFNGNTYLQRKGCAKGTVAAHSFAIVYMVESEEKYICPTMRTTASLWNIHGR